jgi:NAD dependent epimerase/dehydratase family enzyme
MPWIHLHDHVELIAAALSDERFSGPVNVSAPAPVTNREFSRALGRALHRPAFMPLPGFALKLALGEASSVLLSGQRAVPEKALNLGFAFQYAEIDAALSELVGQSGSIEIRRLESA